MAKKRGKQVPIVLIALGAFTLYWAWDHSPKAKLGKIVGNALAGSYTMSEEGFYFSAALGAGLILYGLYKLLKG